MGTCALCPQKSCSWPSAARRAFSLAKCGQGETCPGRDPFCSWVWVLLTSPQAASGPSSRAVLAPGKTRAAGPAKPRLCPPRASVHQPQEARLEGTSLFLPLDLSPQWGLLSSHPSLCSLQGSRQRGAGGLGARVGRTVSMEGQEGLSGGKNGLSPLPGQQRPQSQGWA